MAEIALAVPGVVEVGKHFLTSAYAYFESLKNQGTKIEQLQNHLHSLEKLLEDIEEYDSDTIQTHGGPQLAECNATLTELLTYLEKKNGNYKRGGKRQLFSRLLWPRKVKSIQEFTDNLGGLIANIQRIVHTAGVKM